MSISVLDYYVSVLHEKSENVKYPINHLSYFSMVNSVHNKFHFFAVYSKTNISDSLSNVCGYGLALVVRPLDVDYLAVEAGIQ